MKVTVFTSNQARHINLIRQLASVAETCYAVVEGNTVFPGQVDDFFKKSAVMQRYFSHVIEAERRWFGDLTFLPDNVRPLFVKMGDLNRLERDTLAPCLDSDLFVVFGASYIKGWLIEHLVAQRAINIHMGVSPYYRGSSCNFWALDGNDPHLVGATIHLLSRGLDSGPMLYHAIPTLGQDTPFEFTMRSVETAHSSLVERIRDGSIFDLPPVVQDRAREVKYTRNADFTDDAAAMFLGRTLTNNDIRRLLDIKFDASLYLEPVYG